MKNFLFVVVALSIIIFSGCTRDQNRWSETDASAKPLDVAVEKSGQRQRIILFAPLNVGALASVYPQAAHDYAYRMAEYIDLLVSDADGRVGESLPVSGDSAWDKGRVPAAGGAHLVVLAQVSELRRFETAADSKGRNYYQVAMVDVRAVDIDGRVVLNKQIKGQVPVASSAKFSGPMNEPESLAVWQALSTASGLLKKYLDDNPDLRAIPKQSPTNEINALDITIDSTPAQADIIVDGTFRGTTPQVIALPAKEITITIERQGFQPWSRKVIPVSGMRIQPALQPTTQPIIAPATKPTP
jgi:PEGA domain